MPRCEASDLSLHSLPMSLLRTLGINGLIYFNTILLTFLILRNYFRYTVSTVTVHCPSPIMGGAEVTNAKYIILSMNIKDSMLARQKASVNNYFPAGIQRRDNFA